MKRIILFVLIILLAVSFAGCGVKKAYHTLWDRIELTDELDNAVHNAIVNIISEDEEKAEHILPVEAHKIFAANKKDNTIVVYVYYYGSYLTSNGNPKKEEDFDGSDQSGHVVMFFDNTNGNYTYKSIDEYAFEESDNEFSEFLEENYPDDVIEVANQYRDALRDENTEEYKEFWAKYNDQINIYLESIN